MRNRSPSATPDQNDDAMFDWWIMVGASIVLALLGACCRLLCGSFKAAYRLTAQEKMERGDREHDEIAFPLGWYRILHSSELPMRAVRSVSCLGQELVAFRGEDGRATVLDAICPHLGANLGHGGRVSRGNCITCPFHEWTFNADGQCVDVPYASKCERIPNTSAARAVRRKIGTVARRKHDKDDGGALQNSREDDDDDDHHGPTTGSCGSSSSSSSLSEQRKPGTVTVTAAPRTREDNTLRAWVVCEANGSIYVWYDWDHSGAVPKWALHRMEAQNMRVCHGQAVHEVTCHIQEIAENGPDTAHLPAVHTRLAFVGAWLSHWLTPVISHHWSSVWTPRVGEDSHCADIQLVESVKVCGRLPSFGQTHVHIVQDGPANVFMDIRTIFGIRVTLIQSVLPLKKNLQLITQDVYSASRWSRALANILLSATSDQIQRDVVIWNHKKLLRSPLLIKSDGPILKFRRWMKQFYPRRHVPVIAAAVDD